MTVKLFLVILAVCFFSACSSTSEKEQKNPESIRSDNDIQMSQQLESAGTHVIQMGQTIRIIIPTDILFNPHSANLNAAAGNILDRISKLMLLLETTSVKISGYTDVESNEVRNKALSTQQAKVIANDLWARGMDARFVYSMGYDSTGPSLKLPSNFLGNVHRRIEIQLEYLPLLSSLVK